jgi:hypothetical protein
MLNQFAVTSSRIAERLERPSKGQKPAAGEDKWRSTIFWFRYGGAGVGSV